MSSDLPSTEDTIFKSKSCFYNENTSYLWNIQNSLFQASTVLLQAFISSSELAHDQSWHFQPQKHEMVITVQAQSSQKALLSLSKAITVL